jgi:hypothetical protein
MPYHLPTPEEMELIKVGREMDERGVSVGENEATLKIVRDEIRKYRAEKRRGK